MRKLQYLLILMAFASMVINTLADGTTAGQVPPQLSGLEDSKPVTYYSNVKDIPAPIMDAFLRALGVRQLRMADSGGAWNKTDVVDDLSLPFSRLIWATELNGCSVIHYETGGVRYGTHYMIAVPVNGGGKWVAVWAASGSEQARDYPSFIRDLKEGKLHTDTR